MDSQRPGELSSDLSSAPGRRYLWKGFRVHDNGKFCRPAMDRCRVRRSWEGLHVQKCVGGCH